MSRNTCVAGVAAATLLVAALFSDPLFGGDLLVARDLPRQFYPRCDVLGQALARGEVPRWNPWCGQGASWFGPRAGGVVYPGHLLFGVLPLGRAMAAFIALHALIAVLGAWRLFARDGGASAWPGALAWGLGGFVTSMHWALPYLVSAAWLPWALLGARHIAARERGGVPLLGASVALTLLACEPQGVLILAVLAGVTALVHAPGWRGKLVAVALVGAGGALGAAGGAMTLLSILDELPRLDRGLQSWRELRFELQPIAQTIDALVPNLYGQHAQHEGGFWGIGAWGNKDLPWCAMGVGTLGAIAIVACLWRRGWWREPAVLEALAWVVVGVVLAAFPQVTEKLGLRYPTKWLVITALGLARLVALGAGVLERGTWWAGTAVAAFGVAMTLVGCLVAAFSGTVDGWLAARSPGWVVVPVARTAIGEALLRTGLMALPAAAALWLIETGRVQGRARARALLVGALALDLLTAGRVGLLTLDGGAAPVHAQPPLVATLRARAGGPPGAPVRFEPKEVFWRQTYKPLTFERRELLDRDALRPNIGYRWGIRTVIAFESVEPAGQRQLMYDSRYLTKPLLQRLAYIDGELALCDREEAGNLGVPLERVPVIFELVPPDPSGTIHGYEDLVAVKNPLCPPWAYLVADSVEATDLDDATNQVLDPRFQPGDRVVLGPERTAGAGVQAPAPSPPEAHAVRVLAFEAERVALEVDAPRDAWLVVRDGWTPDWSCAVDGAPTDLWRADLLYRAVRLNAGRREVVFTYAPRWWPPALTLTAVGWLAIALLSAWGSWGRAACR